MNHFLQPKRHYFKHVVLALIVTVFQFAATMTPASANEGYALQPGDTVRASIARLENGTWNSTVDTAGFVRFPYLGSHQASGATLNELFDDIALDVAGRSFTFTGPDGNVVIVLNADDIFLDVARYRPITVSGAVNDPGTIEYEPGLTVRAAIGRSGGLFAAQNGDTSLARVISQTARLNELRSTEAWLLLDLWIIQGEMAPDEDFQPSQDDTRILEERLNPTVLNDARIRIKEARRQHERTRQDLEDRIALSEDRIRFLDQATTQFDVVSQAEEERLERLLTLQEQGLTTVNAVNDARAGALSASSRLLQTEADRADALRELRSLNERSESLDVEVLQSLLADQARVQRALAEVDARITGVVQDLSALARLQIEAEDEASNTMQIAITRYQRTNGENKSDTIDMDAILMPGDVVEIEVVQSDIRR